MPDRRHAGAMTPAPLGLPLAAEAPRLTWAAAPLAMMIRAMAVAGTLRHRLRRLHLTLASGGRHPVIMLASDPPAVPFRA